MMDTEKTTLCRFGDDIVSYLYDELPARDRDIFEAHLPDCTSCTDEFAGTADVRFSVYEWHKEAFAPLATPQFARPYENEKARAGIFAAVAELLTFARPVFAMAAIAVVLGIALIAITFTRSDDRQVASNVEIPTPATQNPPQAVLPPLPEVTGTTAVPVMTAFTPAKAATRSQTPDRSTRKLPAKPQRDIQLQQASRAPVLTNDIDIEDDSLRLTDLFDEVGG